MSILICFCPFRSVEWSRSFPIRIPTWLTNKRWFGTFPTIVRETSVGAQKNETDFFARHERPKWYKRKYLQCVHNTQTGNFSFCGRSLQIIFSEPLRWEHIDFVGEQRNRVSCMPQIPEVSLHLLRPISRRTHPLISFCPIVQSYTGQVGPAGSGQTQLCKFFWALICFAGCSAAWPFPRSRLLHHLVVTNTTYPAR